MAEKKYDRSKYRGTSVAKLNEQEDEVNSKIPKQEDGRPGFHQIAEGKNFFRIYPAKEGEDTYVFPKVVSWIPQEVEVKDEKGKVKKKVERRPVFNSKIHGNLPYDLVEEYQRIANRKIKEDCQDEELIKKKLWAINNWTSGIGPKKGWIMFPDSHSDSKNNEDTKKTFARLEVWDSTYQEMKKKAAALEDDDKEISDPFSDPDTGKLLIITKTTKAKKGGGTSLDYDISIHFKDVPLTDDELMKFDTVEGLSKHLVKCFKRSDFEKQVEGLKLLDEEHEFGVFDDADFIEILDKLEELVPEDDKEEEVLDIEGMDRKALKDLIKSKGLSIKVLPSMSDDKLRELINVELTAEEAKEEIDEEEEEEPEEIEEKPKKNVTTKGKTDEERIKAGKHSKTEDPEAEESEEGEDDEEEDDEVAKKLAKYKESKDKKKK